MQSIVAYQVTVRGAVDPAQINALSPVHVAARRDGPDTRLGIQADQAGIIGLLRFLHHRGIVILSVQRV